MEPINAVNEYFSTYDPEYHGDIDAEECLDYLRVAVGEALNPNKVTQWDVVRPIATEGFGLLWCVIDDPEVIGSGTIYGASMHDLAANAAMVFGIFRP